MYHNLTSVDCTIEIWRMLLLKSQEHLKMDEFVWEVVRVIPGLRLGYFSYRVFQIKGQDFTLVDLIT